MAVALTKAKQGNYLHFQVFEKKLNSLFIYICYFVCSLETVITSALDFLVLMVPEKKYTL